MISFLKKLKKKEKNVLKKKHLPRRLSTLQFQLLVGFGLILAISLGITGVYYGTRIDSLQIDHIEVIGGQTIPHDAIENIANTNLAGAYLLLIPKRFIPLYPKNKIADAIKSHDRIKNVHVEISDGRTLTIVFDEYIPYALWCEKKDSESCLFIDNTGFAFAQAPELDGSAFVRYVEDGKSPEVGGDAFDAPFVKSTGDFIEKLKEQLSLYVTHVSKMGKYDVEYTISGGGIIKVSQTIPMDQSFENLKTILSSEEFAHIEPGSFQYIDLRFGDKIFVNEAPPGNEYASTTHASTSNSL